MIRDKAGFLIRKPHILEQRRDIMGMVSHAKVALHEVLNHRRIPASGGIACTLGACFDPLGELLSLGFGELARPPRRGCVYQAGHNLEKVLNWVIADRLFTERKHCSHFTGVLALSQSQESMDALDQL